MHAAAQERQYYQVRLDCLPTVSESRLVLHHVMRAKALTQNYDWLSSTTASPDASDGNMTFQ
jgi:hypothetical protein